MNSTGYYKPLNVKDALNYLDQVKSQFASRPDVYNNFLDIMKDFKSHAIDTPGVIDRVSALFKGYIALIQGFNTFLPPGYKIMCSTDADGKDMIQVSTPMGKIVPARINMYRKPSQDAYETKDFSGGFELYGHKEKSTAGVQEPHIGTLKENDFAAQRDVQQIKQQTMPPNQEQQTQQQQQQPQQQQPQPQQQPITSEPQQQPQSSFTHLQAAANRGTPSYTAPAATTVTTSVGAGASSTDTTSATSNERKTTPVEFNHAISYVNKIKTRYAASPDIYKKFLEILQTYQREQKPISDVYTEVTLLFQGAPDLLNDFKQFLPDTNGESQIGKYAGTGAAAASASAQAQLPPVGNFSPPTAGDKHEEPPITSGTVINGTNRLPEIQTSSVRDEAPRRKLIDDIASTLVPGIPEPIEPGANKASNLVEEISFFDKAKKAIGSKQTYNEFLKILNLFNQDLIDKDTLVERVEGFIGAHPDLFDWFKAFVGFDESPYYIENITFKKHQLDLLLCKPYGPSYRKLPKVETLMPCSGRDDMCWEVLNDEWVGHPTWASEDSGFIAHRKNQYEEILFKIEEERHEYDFYMESNLRTIQTLETIANRIANMTTEEKEAFKLPSGLGHTSQTIYKKVVRKVYGKEKGFEVIDALHAKPAISVPIVLKRLKQKDEEWRKSHREWNKVWREMEQRVFFKSLDHMGLTFKQTDKKLLTSKQLISEISTIKSEQTNKRLHPLTPKPQRQLDYDFHDHEVLFDIVKFIHVYTLAQGPYSIADREKIVEFAKFFVSLFFSIDQQVVEDALSKRIQEGEEKQRALGNIPGADASTADIANGATPSVSSESEDSSATATPSNGNAASSAPSRKRHRDTDLLKDVLKRAKQTKSEDSAATAEAGVDQKMEEDEEEENKPTEHDSVASTWINTNEEAKSGQNAKNENNNRTTFNLFGNTNIYLFFRHLRVLYERLLEVKNLNEEVTNDIKSRNEVQFAKDLNLINNQLAEMGLEFTKDDAYSQLLTICEKSVEGELDHQWFEESLRQAYRNRAFKLYTVDKVVQALVKHLHTVITDTRTAEIMYLFQADRRAEKTSATDQIVYRTKVRAQMNQDDNMFRIEFNKDTQHVCIQFIALDDLTLQDHKTDEEKWDYYMTTYVISHPTEGVDSSVMNLPFINEHLLGSVEEESFQAYLRPELKIKIQPENYKLFFEKNTSDEFTKYSVYNKAALSEEDLKKEKSQEERKLRKFKKSMEQQFVSSFRTSTENDGEDQEMIDEDAGIDEKVRKLQQTFDLLKTSPNQFKESLERAKLEASQPQVKPESSDPLNIDSAKLESTITTVSEADVVAPESEITRDEDQDQTIEKADETIPEANTTTTTTTGHVSATPNAAESLLKKKSLTERVLEQSGDLTVDADSTVAQDETAVQEEEDDKTVADVKEDDKTAVLEETVKEEQKDTTKVDEESSKEEKKTDEDVEMGSVHV